jgi:WD repeat-containing protein 19
VHCSHVQELFLRSSRPLAALEMRQDLKHWPQALALAQQLAPDRLPQLNKEHAGLLELVGDHAAAATHYQQVRRLLARQQGGVRAYLVQTMVEGVYYRR